MSMTVDPYEISKYLRSNYGLGPKHISGILANIKGESGFDPTINEVNPTVTGSRGGYGLFQHTGPRRTKLEKMPNYQDWRSQIDFAMNEPEGRDYAAQKFTSPVEAVSYFVRNFERPRYVEEAIRKRTVDVRQASNAAGSTDTDRTPSGDPVTGLMTHPRAQTMLPPFPSMPPTGQQEASTPDWFTPIISLLAGAAMSRGGGLDRVLSGAALAGTGIQATQKAENELLDLKQRRIEAARRRRGQDSLEQWSQQMISSGDPQQMTIGQAMQVSPDAGVRMYGDYQQEQRKAQERAAAAARYRELGDERAAVNVESGYAPGERPAPAAPTMREVHDGDQTITKQWDPSSGGWSEVSRAPRWQPKPEEGGLGNVPQGMRRVQDQASPTGTTLVPEPGGPIDVERNAKVESLKQGLSRVDRMREMIADPNIGSTELFGENSGTIRQLYAQAVADVAKIREMGVLQPGEMKNIEDRLVDPSSWSSVLTAKKTVQAQYDELRKSYADKLRGMGIAPPPDSIGSANAPPPPPPGFEVMP